MQAIDNIDKEVLLDSLAECRLTASAIKIKSGRHGNLFEALEDLVRALDKAADDVTGERRFLQRLGGRVHS